MLNVVIFIIHHPYQVLILFIVTSILISWLCNFYITKLGVEDGFVTEQEAIDIINDRYPIEIIEQELEYSPLNLKIDSMNLLSMENCNYSLLIGESRIGSFRIGIKILKKIFRTFKGWLSLLEYLNIKSEYVCCCGHFSQCFEFQKYFYILVRGLGKNYKWVIKTMNIWLRLYRLQYI